MSRLTQYLKEGSFNKDNVRELVLFITSDGDLYRQRITPTIKNLKKHMAKGKFNKTESLKSWQRIADEGAKKYDKEFSSAGAKTFSVADRKQVAVELADEYQEELDYKD